MRCTATSTDLAATGPRSSSPHNSLSVSNRFNGDLPHPVPRLGPVSHEPYAEPGCGPSVIREPHVHAACRGQLPLSRRRKRTSADTGLQALHHRAVRAQIKVIGRDASAVAARDAGKVPVWLSRR